MTKLYWLFLLFFIFTHCTNSQVKNELLESKIFISLPNFCPTPDAFAVAPDGSLMLTCPNYAEKEQPGIIVKINSDKTITKIGKVPGIKNGTFARPMGIDYAPDGSLYVCANPRILRLTLSEDSIKTVEVVATGIQGPNGLKIHNDAVYVTTPILKNFKTSKITSGVYRFSLSDRNIEVKGDSTDSNLIFTTQTQNPRRQFGLDGLVFDNKDNLLVGDFGDGIIYRLKLDDNGDLLNQEIYAELPDSSGIDGMVYDRKGNLYVAGFSQNEIWKVDTNRNAKVIARYPDNKGENGELDQPSDLVIKDGKLIIANFDLMTEQDMVNRSHNKPYTLSYIELEE